MVVVVVSVIPKNNNTSVRVAISYWNMASKKKTVRQTRKRKNHAISPIHSAAEDSGGDGVANIEAYIDNFYFIAQYK